MASKVRDGKMHEQAKHQAHRKADWRKAQVSAVGSSIGPPVCTLTKNCNILHIGSKSQSAEGERPSPRPSA
eukprot:1194041-Prorocentrum_minimum.AAC.2